MTKSASYETDIDGVHITIKIEGASAVQDPSVVRERITKLAAKLATAIEDEIIALERGE